MGTKKKPKGYYGTRKHGRPDKYSRYGSSGRREANKARRAAKKAKAYARRASVRDGRIAGETGAPTAPKAAV